MSRVRFGPAFVAAACAVYVPKVWLADTSVYTNVLTPQRLVTIGAVAKLACLVAASLLTALAARALERDNPARRAWGGLAFGLGGFAVGQAGLMTYQLVLVRDPPLPSIGDAAFLIGYPAIIVALVAFVRAYVASGLPVGSPRAHAVLAGAMAAALATIAIPLLRPIALAQAPLAERAINVAYPALDFIAIVPLVVLVRMAWSMRGGAIGRIWLTLLGGFASMAAGDVLFSYFSSVGAKQLEPLVDLMLLLGYYSVALGARRQLELTR